MQIGEHIGPFEIEKELGSGAMGTVYKARFNRDGKVTPVAIKMIAFGLLGNDAALARFEREVAILKQLKHPHVVRLIADGKYKKTPFIAMEFVDGDSLDRVLTRRGGKLPWEDVVAFGRQLCEALQHAHDKGIIHRDLKPSNLMITKAGVLKLTDFGIAKDTDVTALTGANSTIGTAAYMSPEQCRGERDLANKSDLYSLGIVFYELLTGKKPFTAETSIDMFLKHVNETAVRPRRVVPDVPVWLDNLVMHLMEKDKEKRPLDAAMVGRMLAEIEEKVRSGQSVGAAVANARAIDRPVGELDDADKEAARSLRTGGKKKKKKAKGPPWYQATWVMFAGLAVILLGLVGLGFYVFRPEGVDAAYARVEQAEGPDAKLIAAADFLAAHGTGGDPKVEQARAVFRDARARKTEAVIAKRIDSKLKGNWESFDEEAYKLAVQAIDAERAGNLKRAGDLWGDVQKATPDLPADRWADEDAVMKASLGWVAAKRVREIKQLVPEALAKVQKLVTDARLYELPVDAADRSPEARAARALRLAAPPHDDKAKAKAVWDDLAASASAEADQRAWFLLASQQSADITIPKDADPKADRIARLDRRLTEFNAARAALAEKPDDLVAARDLRNALRETVALYDDESDAKVATVVRAAKALLDAIPKKN